MSAAQAKGKLPNSHLTTGTNSISRLTTAWYLTVQPGVAVQPLPVQKSASFVPNPTRLKACGCHRDPRRRGGPGQQQVGTKPTDTIAHYYYCGGKKIKAGNLQNGLLFCRLHEQVEPIVDPEIDLSRGLSRLGYAPTSDTVAFTRKALDLDASDRVKKSNSEHVNKALGSILPKTYTGQCNYFFLQIF